MLFPVLEFFDEVVVAFSDFGDFTVHTGFEMNIILPCFTDFSCECVLFPDHFVEMPHTDFGHDGLFLVALEDCGHAGIATHFLANMIDDVQDGILIPPFRILDTFDLATHHLILELTMKREYNDRAGGLEFAIRVCFAEEARRSCQCNCGSIGATESSSESGDELGSLSRSKKRGWARGHDIVPVEIDEQCLLSV